MLESFYYKTDREGLRITSVNLTIQKMIPMTKRIICTLPTLMPIYQARLDEYGDEESFSEDHSKGKDAFAPDNFPIKAFLVPAGVGKPGVTGSAD